MKGTAHAQAASPLLGVYGPVGCQSAASPGGGSPLRPYRGPSLSEQGWEGKPLEGGSIWGNLGAEKLEKDNFLAANHPRPSTGFISFNPTASPQDSPSGYDEGHEAMNDSCSWSDVGSHAHVHTNWFCSLDRLLNYFPPPPKVSLSVKSRSQFLLGGGSKGDTQGMACHFWNWFSRWPSMLRSPLKEVRFWAS